jgi:hypothetical protein
MMMMRVKPHNRGDQKISVHQEIHMCNQACRNLPVISQPLELGSTGYNSTVL